MYFKILKHDDKSNTIKRKLFYMTGFKNCLLEVVKTIEYKKQTHL